jgi:ADP-ribosylglycohydrolase
MCRIDASGRLTSQAISQILDETAAAVLWCATKATSLRNGLVSAVQLGGDTDTVAALVGGLMGGKLTAEEVHAELPWHQLVVLPEPDSALAETAAALATIRAIQSVWPSRPDLHGHSLWAGRHSRRTAAAPMPRH